MQSFHLHHITGITYAPLASPDRRPSLPRTAAYFSYLQVLLLATATGTDTRWLARWSLTTYRVRHQPYTQDLVLGLALCALVSYRSPARPSSTISDLDKKPPAIDSLIPLVGSPSRRRCPFFCPTTARHTQPTVLTAPSPLQTAPPKDSPSNARRLCASSSALAMVMNDSGARPSRSSVIMTSNSPTGAAAPAAAPTKAAAAAAAAAAADDTGEKNPARRGARPTTPAPRRGTLQNFSCPRLSSRIFPLAAANVSRLSFLHHRQPQTARSHLSRSKNR